MQNPAINSSHLAADMLAIIIAATCLLLGNIYYAQPVLYEIAETLQINIDDCGLLVAFGQAGYIMGLLFIAPLGDIIDNRKLCASMTFGAAIFAIISATANMSTIFLAGIFFMGIFATATQILIVFATSLAWPGHAGRTLGILACGLFLGIALSRPVSSFVTATLGWRYVYAISGTLLFAVSALIYIILLNQHNHIKSAVSYFKMIREMLSIPFHTRHFFQYTILSFFAFFGFTIFWSSAPLYLSESMKCDQNFITFFTMSGLITPPLMLFIGWLLDRDENQKITLSSLLLISAGWLLLWLSPRNLSFFFIAAFMIDPCSSATTVTVQKNILASVEVEKRGRANSLNISINFFGGTLGATMGPWLLGKYSWSYLSLTGIIVTSGLLIYSVYNIYSNRRSINE